MCGMKVIVVACLAALALAGAVEARKVDILGRELMRLGQAAKCADKASPWRLWCIAVDFRSGSAAELPKGKTLLGLTIAIGYDKDVGAALRDRVSLSVLAVGATGKVKETALTPSNADETKPIAEAVFNVSAVLKGKAKTAKVPEDLAAYIKTITPTYDATKSGDEWIWQGKTYSEARKVDAYWIVVEHADPDEGIFVSIFTDAWE